MASPLAWRETFGVGHSGLDAEHKLIIETIGELWAAVEDEVTPHLVAERLTALMEIVEKHFRHENAVLREIIATGNAPSSKRRRRSQSPLKAMSANALNDHINDHQASLHRLTSIIGNEGGAKAGASAFERRGELVAWFLDHAVKHDAHLKAIFQAM
jgi:hemerythrin